MRTPNISIRGIGVFIPEIMSIEQAIAQGRYSAEDAEAHELTGAAVAGDIPAPEMALRAARSALERCGQRPDELDLLLYADSWHQGPDGWQPQYYLQHHLVGGNLLAVEVRQGCNGMFSAMELAAAYLRSAPGPDGSDSTQTALLVAADNFGTPMYDRWRGPGYVTGDAACAVVLANGPGFAQLLSVRSAAVAEAEEMHRGDKPLFPPGPTVGDSLDFAVCNSQFRRRALAEGSGTAALFRIAPANPGSGGADAGRGRGRHHRHHASRVYELLARNRGATLHGRARTAHVQVNLAVRQGTRSPRSERSDRVP